MGVELGVGRMWGGAKDWQDGGGARDWQDGGGAKDLDTTGIGDTLVDILSQDW